MRLQKTRLGLVATLALVTGCTSGQVNSVPGFTSVNLNQNKAQLAVGVATFADGTTGLNAVETFRQPNGLSATLANTPTITGPTGFLVPAGFGGVDGGTNHISGSPQVPVGQTAIKTTFKTSGGAFAYGFAPENSTASGAANFALYDGAFYDAVGALTGFTIGQDDSGNNIDVPVEFRGGPPAYPTTTTGAFPPGFSGYTQGFTTFATPPVAGAYGFSIAISSSNNAGATIVGTPGTITDTSGIGAVTKPAFVEDGAGGGTATCVVPGKATEVLVDLTDIYAGTFYTVLVKGSGAISATFAANLGPVSSGAATATIGSHKVSGVVTGDEYSVSCIAVNYPAFEAGPPGNVQQLPTIVGSNGQADISFSPNLDVAAY